MFAGGVVVTLMWNVCRWCGRDFEVECLQVVWDESREVGCGYSHCDPMTLVAIPSGVYLVCNYGPA